MNEKVKKYLSQDWEYYISRNVTFWHNSLSLLYGEKGYSLYKLPPFIPLKVHRGFHSDFYVLSEAINKFNKQLQQHLQNQQYLIFLKKKYNKDGKKLFQFSQNLSISYNKFNNFFHYYGLCYPMLDITATGSKLITDKVLGLLPNNEERVDVIAYYSKPKRLAPLQMLEKEIEQIVRKKINIQKEAQRLHQKYCWIPVSFVGEPWDINYFIKRIRSYKVKSKRGIPKPKTKISTEAKYNLSVLRDITELNEFRKAIFSQVNFNIRYLFNSLAKSKGMSDWKEISLLTNQEILDLVRGKYLNTAYLLSRRKKPCLLYTKDFQKIEFIYGQEVTDFEKRYQKNFSHIKQFSGTSAGRGLIKGRVKIILEQKDFHKFSAGDILVAKMTSVDFIPIMKKAGAFVTDEGGLACHAAVVSREYLKPCIVGTKIATQVLKDGDWVEVDASKGLVKKL